MLTVKQITLSGMEFVWEALNVQYMPGKMRDELATTGPNPDALFFNSPTSKDQIEITGGTVFVTNDHGKTVSRYDLGASMVGFDVDPLRTASETEPFPAEMEKNLNIAEAAGIIKRAA